MSREGFCRVARRFGRGMVASRALARFYLAPGRPAAASGALFRPGPLVAAPGRF